MKKIYKEKNVYEATQDRLKIIFNEFDNVLVSFSGGKDSGVLLNSAYEYAKKNDLLHKLSVYSMDYEADFEQTHEYLERVFCENNFLGMKKYWLCLPVSAKCAVSMKQTHWTPWDKNKIDLWCRDMPKSKAVINEDNCPFDFEKGTYGADVRINFTKWFANTYGKTAVLVGIRCDESLNRLAILTSQHRVNMYKQLRYSKKLNKNTYTFYPIYDWTTQDVWIANYKYEWDYNKIYDLMYKAGVSIHDMRVASPFHQSAIQALHLFRALSPNTWAKMVNRVNGVNFANIYGNTTAMGWKGIKKPEHFTWKEYAEFLLSTMSKDVQDKFNYHIERYEKEWSQKGRGRNPKVIKLLIDEGLEIERTGEICLRCKKEDIYEIVKIKSDFVDEAKNDYSTPFRHCPSWKAICITIMKNDFSLQYMGLARTKKDLEKRKIALQKYKNL